MGLGREIGEGFTEEVKFELNLQAYGGALPVEERKESFGKRKDGNQCVI